MKQLCEIQVEYTIYAYVDPDDYLDVEDVIRESGELGDVSENEIRVFPIRSSSHRLSGGWNKECLVWGVDEDVTLGDALDKLEVE